MFVWLGKIGCIVWEKGPYFFYLTFHRLELLQEKTEKNNFFLTFLDICTPRPPGAHLRMMWKRGFFLFAERRFLLFPACNIVQAGVFYKSFFGIRMKKVL